MASIFAAEPVFSYNSVFGIYVRILNKLGYGSFMTDCSYRTTCIS